MQIFQATIDCFLLLQLTKFIIVLASLYKTEKLQSTVTDCLSLCEVFGFRDPHGLQCARYCENDPYCAFFYFHDEITQCYMCTSHLTRYEGSKFTKMPQLEFSSNFADHIIYKKEDRFQNFDQCLFVSDCSIYQTLGYEDSGTYNITLESGTNVKVYCDMDTDGGGWTVIQRRQDGSVDFQERTWEEYEQGFGDPDGDFWLGNDVISQIAESGNYEIRFDMIENGVTMYAVYSSFSLDKSDKYRLSIGSYSGDAGDGMSYHNNKPFSTPDQDNDADSGNCADLFKAGWWFGGCFYTNLNGDFSFPSPSRGIHWDGGSDESRVHLSFAEMKIRPTN